MIATTSLELSQELYELSGWKDTERCWVTDITRPPRTFVSEWNTRNTPDWYEEKAPAYDLGYLLRKLPDGVVLRRYASDIYGIDSGPLTHQEESSPEDAAAKLAIELFKQGVLKREDK